MISYLQEPLERLTRFIHRRGCYDLHRAGLYMYTLVLFTFVMSLAVERRPVFSSCNLKLDIDMILWFCK